MFSACLELLFAFSLFLLPFLGVLLLGVFIGALRTAHDLIRSFLFIGLFAVLTLGHLT